MAESGSRDRLAVVTGTSSGIGAALARELLGRGWKVVGIARRPAEIHADAYDHVAQDLADTEAVERRLLPRLERELRERAWDRVALVNNAADAGQMLRMQALSGDALRELLQANVAAPMLLTGMFLGACPKDATIRILNVSSGAATAAFPALADYCVSKAALRMAGMVAAVEADASGRSEFALRSYEPNTVDTPMQATARSRDPAEFPLAPWFRERQADGRLVDAADVAADMADWLEGDGPRGFSEVRFDPAKGRSVTAG